MVAILQKKFLGLEPGTIFYRKTKLIEDRVFDIYQCSEHLDKSGEGFWLSEGFVLGEFESGYAPLCWNKDLFAIIP